MRHAMFCTAHFLKYIGPTLDRRHLALERKETAWHCAPAITVELSPQCASHNPASKVFLPRSSRAVAAGTQQGYTQHSYKTPPRHTHHVSPLLCASLSRRVNAFMGDCLLKSNERQKRVTLEKLKSWSVIAGTRNLPVSDVMASAGLVKAPIRLKTRSGLS